MAGLCSISTLHCCSGIEQGLQLSVSLMSFGKGSGMP